MIKKPKEFDPSTKRFMGFGYEVAVTPLQLVNSYAAIANEGNLMKPYIYMEFGKDGGKKPRQNTGIVRRIWPRMCGFLARLKHLLKRPLD